MMFPGTEWLIDCDSVTINEYNGMFSSSHAVRASKSSLSHISLLLKLLLIEIMEISLQSVSKCFSQMYILWYTSRLSAVM